MSYYFDFGHIEPDSVAKHLLSQSGGTFPPLNLISFLGAFSSFKGQFSSISDGDQLDLLKQLCDYLARTVVSSYKNQQTIQSEKLANAKKVKELQSELTDIQNRNNKLDFQAMTHVNNHIIKLQSWFRMLIVRKKLIKKSNSKNEKVDPNRELVNDFFNALRQNKITPEEFLRAIDKERNGKVPVEKFIEEILSRKLVPSRNHATRLAFIIDEDVSGDITQVELQKTLKSFQLQVENSAFTASEESGQSLTYEQFSLIKIFNQLSRRSIEVHELYNAIDVDNNLQITCDELTRFLKTILNTEELKLIQDKDIRFFLNFMDLDRNNMISKGEFLKSFQKIEQLAQKHKTAYNKISTEEKTQGKDLSTIQSEIAVKGIVLKMQQEGICVQQFINHLPTIAEPNSRLIKLGLLLRQLQLSYPNLTVDEFRSLLKWLKVQAGGKYDYLELQVFISRFISPDFGTNSSLHQTLKVLAENLKQRELSPELFISKHFFDRSPTILFENFNQVLQTVFSLPQLCIADLYNSLLIDQQIVQKSDLLTVLKSFKDGTQPDALGKINLQNISDFIKDYQPQHKRSQIATLISEKLKERKLTLLNVFKMASLAQPLVKKEQVLRTFEKLLPNLDREVIQVVFRKEQYQDKEEFMLEIEVQEKKELEIQEKQDLIRVLDSALLNVRVSPSVVFEEADTNGDGVIELREMAEVFSRIGITLDEITLNKIFKELDVNGSGSIDKQEFFELFRTSRNQSNVKTAVDNTIPRSQLLPTRANLLKMTNQALPSAQKPIVLNNALMQALNDVESHISLQDALLEVDIDLNLFFDLRDLAAILKSKGVSLPRIVNLYSLLDPKYIGSVKLPEMLSILSNNKQQSIGLIEYKLISRVIYASCCNSVEEYFMKNSDSLNRPEQKLQSQDIEKEFSRLFQLEASATGSLFKILKDRYGKNIHGVLNEHMYEFLQPFYSQFHPSNLPSRDPQMNSSLAIHSRDSQTSIPAQNPLKVLFLRLLGADPSPISLSQLVASRYPQPRDLTLQDFQTALMPSQRSQILNQAECKNLFQFILETSGSSKNKFLNSAVTADVLREIEESIARQAVREITVKIEEKIKKKMNQWIVDKIKFVEEGVISRFALIEGMIGAVDGVEGYEVRVLVEKMADKQGIIGVESMQEYLKLYTKEKEISSEIYFKYFAYVLEKKKPQVSTAKILIIQPGQANLSQQAQFTQLLRIHFPSLTNNEHIFDLYDFLPADTPQLAYLSSRLDLLRPSLGTAERFKLRSSPELLTKLRSDLASSSGKAVYRLLDSVPFTPHGIIPSHLLLQACTKMIPKTAEFFMLLCDTNGDGKIEVDEFVEFAKSLDKQPIDFNEVARRMAIIVENTSVEEEKENGFEQFMHKHGVPLKDEIIGFSDWCDLVQKVFRLSRYEAYLVYKEIGQGQKIERIRIRETIDKEVALIREKKRQEEALNSLAEEKIRVEVARKEKIYQEKQREAQSEADQSLAAKKKPKISNADVLKIFIDNFKAINNILQIKSACLKLQQLKKASPQLRARLFTQRACQVSALYTELGRPDPQLPFDSAISVSQLTEIDKVLLSVLALQQVDRTYECNIYRFKQLLDRLTSSSLLDFQMLLGILSQRFTQIETLLIDDFITIEDIIEKIKKNCCSNGGENGREREVWIEAKGVSGKRFAEILGSIGARLRGPEMRIIEKELQSGYLIPYDKVKLFLAQCGIRCVQQAQITKVFASLEQAKIELDIIKRHLSEHPYFDLNQDLVTINDESLSATWQFVQSFDATFSNRLSQLHGNQMVIDCMIQLNQNQSDDQLGKLIIHEDSGQDSYPMMIVKIDSQYVLCDMKLPFIQNIEEETSIPAFSYHSSQPKLHFVEKALSVYLHSYENLQNSQKLASPLAIIQRYLNADLLEPYPLSSCADPYSDLFFNFFQPGVMSHCTYIQQKAAKGLELGRVYAIVGLVRLQVEGNKEQKLIVVRNPYNREVRLDTEVWSKGYLENEKKNKKDIEGIVKGYGQNVFEMVKSRDSNLYLYNFSDVFDSKSNHILYLIYNLSKDNPNYFSHHSQLSFKDAETNFSLTLQPPVKKQITSINNLCFSYLIVDYDDDSPSTFKISYLQKSWTFSTPSHGRLYCQTLLLPYNDPVTLTLSRLNSSSAEESVEVTLFSKATEKVVLSLTSDNKKEILEESKGEKSIDGKLNDSRQNLDEAYILNEGTKTKQKVLFVCIHNSARSQMAEAFLNQLGLDQFEAESAGLEPGTLNPMVVNAMQEVGIDISKAKTKSVAEMLKRSQVFSYIITVCDEASAERCPTFPGPAKRLHWGFPDPSVLQGTSEERLIAIREIRNQIRKKVDEWTHEISKIDDPSINQTTSKQAKDKQESTQKKQQAQENTLKKEEVEVEEEYEEYDYEEDLERAEDDKEIE